MPNDYKLVEVEESEMAVPSGYNPGGSLLPDIRAPIAPVMGGSMVGGADERDIKLFGQVYKIPNPASLNETDIGINKNIQDIMRLLNFNTLSFDEKKKILQAIYDSNCTNETDLALSCGCDPVRKVIADLATLLLKKTAESVPLPTPVKRVDTVKKQVEISIRIPLEMIRVVMGSGSASASGSFEQVVGENSIPRIAELKEQIKGQQDEAKRKLLESELEAERAEFEVKKYEEMPTRTQIEEKELQQKREHAAEAREKFKTAATEKRSFANNVRSAFESSGKPSPEIPFIQIPTGAAAPPSPGGQIAKASRYPTTSAAMQASAASNQAAQQVTSSVSLTPGGEEGNATAISFGGNNTRKLRLSTN